MSIDFTPILRSAYAEGLSPEDMVTAFTDALNSLSNPKDDYLKSLSTTPTDLSTALETLTYYMAQEHPDWDTDDLQSFHSSIKDNISLYTKLRDSSLEEMATSFIDHLKDNSAINDFLNLFS